MKILALLLLLVLDLPRPPPPPMKQCSNCQTMNEPSRTKCRNCGADI